ncbi:RNA-binding protein Musashi homolog 2-like [Leguminivora glycinivorella]|uniref:RNA-binding protein Musashi homolog 2-like n=1 Tax=Leguminivora glycinivorella TaxID=1035111 RepID=UPI002010A9D2|nr:RNA-binding protein Musashi homolog 2-like [Leguminivora glycinivorella]
MQIWAMMVRYEIWFSNRTRSGISSILVFVLVNLYQSWGARRRGGFGRRLGWERADRPCLERAGGCSCRRHGRCGGPPAAPTTANCCSTDKNLSIFRPLVARARPPSLHSPSPSKLFVGGLSWQTSSEKLREYFAMFGAVTDVLIMKDPVTQRSRGFGFITFQEAASVDKVLAVPVHTLDGKRIDPKHATPKSAPRPAKTKKIFVGGVGQDTSADEVRAYFAQFGHVEDAVMLMDQQTKRHRGFGFVTFHSEEAVERVCDIHFHTIKNKKVECKRAQPKEAVAAAPLALGKRLVLRPGRGLVYATGGVGAVPAVGAAHAYRYAPYALPAAAGAAALVAPPQPAPPPAMPQFGAAYSLAGVDMSSFQSVDWGAMYGLPMYI